MSNSHVIPHFGIPGSSTLLPIPRCACAHAHIWSLPGDTVEELLLKRNEQLIFIQNGVDSIRELFVFFSFRSEIGRKKTAKQHYL